MVQEFWSLKTQNGESKIFEGSTQLGTEQTCGFIHWGVVTNALERHSSEKISNLQNYTFFSIVFVQVILTGSVLLFFT